MSKRNLKNKQLTKMQIIEWILESIEDVEKTDSYHCINTMLDIELAGVSKVRPVKIEVYVGKTDCRVHQLKKMSFDEVSKGAGKPGDLIGGLPVFDFFASMNNQSVLFFGYYNNEVSIDPIIVSITINQGSILKRKRVRSTVQ